MDNLRWQKGPLNNYKSLACGKTSTALSIYSLFLTPAEIHFARIFSHRNCVIPMTSTAPEKRLIVAVEGTAALGPYWRTIVNDYLEKIVRYFFLLFCLIEGIEKKKGLHFVFRACLYDYDCVSRIGPNLLLHCAIFIFVFSP